MEEELSGGTARISRRGVLKLAIGSVLGAGLFSLMENPTSPTLPLAAAPAQAASWCWCVDYVKNAYRLTGSSGNAKDMGPYLAARGFRRVSGPAGVPLWSIVIIQPGYGGGIDARGHVALLARYWSSGKDLWTVVLRGTNQPGYQWTEQGCTNVSDWQLARPVPSNSPHISYWVR